MTVPGVPPMETVTKDARAWWPGRTDEVRRVADCISAIPDDEYEHMTIGDLAGRTSSGVFIVCDALDLLNETSEAIAALATEVKDR